MDSTSLLLSGLLFSSAGIGYLIYGRRQKQRVFFYCGLGLMGFPYLVADMFQMVAIGVLLLITPRYLEL